MTFRPFPGFDAQLKALMEEGHSVAAAACRLGCSEVYVRKWLPRLGMSRWPIPEGYLKLSEVAREFRIAPGTITRAAKLGLLRVVYHHRRRIVRPEWVENWLRNNPYRQKAMKLASRVLKKGSPKPTEPLPAEPGSHPPRPGQSSSQP